MSSNQKAFFQLPILSTLKALDFMPHKGQVSLLNKIDTTRFVVAKCGRRWGKSALLAHLGVATMLVPNQSVGVAAPTYNLSNIIFESILKKIKSVGLETVRVSYKERIVELENGSILRGLTTSSPDSLVGKAFDLLILDEIALEQDLKLVFNQHLRPTLTDNPNSRCVFISTPRGRNYFKELYDRGADQEFQNWVTHSAPSSENPLLSKEDIEDARKGTSEAVFRQEYLAEFTMFDGQIYKTVNTKENLPSLVTDDFWYIIGFDPGYRHPTGGVVVATDGDYYFVIEDYKLGNTTTETHAEWLSEMIDKYDVDEVYIDTAAAQTRQDLASLYDVPSLAAIKNVNSGISACSALFENGKLIIDEGCEHLLSELAVYAWKGLDNSGNDVVLKINDDVCDAMRYAIYSSTVKPIGVSFVG